MIRLAAVIGLVAALSAGLAGADLRAGMLAYQQGDFTRARAEFEVLAEAGDPEAQYMLGQIHANGRGVLQNYVEAHKWFNLSAAGGYAEGARARDAVARNMTPAQIAEAQGQARSWRPRAVSGGPVSASSGPTRETVRTIQSELNRLGYNVGTPDGIAGSRTREAIRDFEKAHGMPVTGQPSDNLLLRVRVAARNAPPQQSAAPAVSAGASARVGGGGGSEALVAEIETLVAEAEKKRLADPGFLARLRTVLRRHGWPWKREVFQDSFRDGEFTSNPRWNVASGQFRVDYQSGLRSTVQPRAQSSGQNQRQQDIGKVILGAILSEVAGQGGGAQGSDPSVPAEIYLSGKIGAGFAIQMTMRSAEGTGAFEFGPYTGGDRNGGYRLRYQPGAPLELVRLARYGGGVVEASRETLRLEDGADHTIQWTRDEGGEMEVSVDGRTLLQASDRGVQGDFDGFTMVNRAGDFSVRSISVMDAGK